MEDNSIIAYLYDRKLEDNLFTLSDPQLKRLQQKIRIVDKEISNFITNRVHPKSRRRLQKLLFDYSNAVFLNASKENELYYKSGARDGVKFIIDSLTAK